MAKKPDFDIGASHRYFSAHCFNRAWDLIEKPTRTPEEDEEMVRLSQASIWHWTERPDCEARNLSIGYWQVSRIHAVLGRAEEARRYGRLCLDNSRQEPPFFLAYAYEALARAEQVGGNPTEAAKHHAEAVRLAGLVEDAEDKKLLLADLETIL